MLKGLEAGAEGPEAGLARAARVRGFGWIVHSVLGVEGVLDRLVARAALDPARRTALLRGGFAGDGAAGGDLRAALAHLLVARAFACNPDGVVLVSMFSERSLRANLAAAQRAPDPAAAALVALGVLAEGGTR